MEELKLEPFAPLLLESMRAVGYSPESAVADLIDNSITAKASHIQARFPPGLPKHFGLLDDGDGMTKDELVAAMRHGSRSPHDIRGKNDLGRFGLGLKTASMSQCRRLTVVSKKAGFLSAMVWDLDDVADKEDWIAGVLSSAEIDQLPYVAELRSQAKGTLVLWAKLDRFAAGDRGDGTVLGERVEQIRSHISLVFHRYIKGEAGLTPVNISINGNHIAPLDPFLSSHRTTQTHPAETITLDGHQVRIQAFTLPHISRLTRAEIEEAGGEQGLRREQGFYVYRERRLIVWGTWFRMFRQEELTKLTRVQVDIPNALDHLWTLDIKKSAASPPQLLRERLRTLIPTMCRNSKVVQAFRGRVTTPSTFRPIWSRIEDRDGVRYEIDNEHPVIASHFAGLDDDMSRSARLVMHAIADSLPVEAIYNDRANERMGFRPDSSDGGKQRAILEELARQMLDALEGMREQKRLLLDSLERLEPFVLYPAITREIKEKLSDT